MPIRPSDDILRLLPTLPAPIKERIRQRADELYNEQFGILQEQDYSASDSTDVREQTLKQAIQEILGSDQPRMRGTSTPPVVPKVPPRNPLLDQQVPGGQIPGRPPGPAPANPLLSRQIPGGPIQGAPPVAPKPVATQNPLLSNLIPGGQIQGGPPVAAAPPGRNPPSPLAPLPTAPAAAPQNSTAAKPADRMAGLKSMLGKGDLGLRLLQLLGATGMGLSQSGAVKKANKQNAQAQARANLIGSLSRRGQPQVTPRQPAIGKGGQISSFLANLGQTGLSAKQQVRAEDEMARKAGIEEEELDIKRQVAAGKLAPDPTKPTDLKTAAADIGASVYERGGTIEEVVAEVQTAFPNITPAVSAELAGLARQGWRKAEDLSFNRGIKTDAEERAKQRHLWETKSHLTEEEDRAVERITGQIVNDVKVSVRKGENVAVRPTLADTILRYQDQLANFSPDMQKEIGRQLIQAWTETALDEADRIAKDQTGDAVGARTAIAEADAFLTRIDQLEKLFDEAWFTGRVMGRVPVTQWSESSFVLEGLLEGLGFEVARMINGSRPSDRDVLIAAEALTPKRSNTDATAKLRWNNLRQMAQARKEAFRSNFHLRDDQFESFIGKDGTIDFDGIYTAISEAPGRQETNAATRPTATPPQEGTITIDTDAFITPQE